MIFSQTSYCEIGVFCRCLNRERNNVSFSRQTTVNFMKYSKKWMVCLVPLYGFEDNGSFQTTVGANQAVPDLCHSTFYLHGLHFTNNIINKRGLRGFFLKKEATYRKAPYWRLMPGEGGRQVELEPLVLQIQSLHGIYMKVFSLHQQKNWYRNE